MHRNKLHIMLIICAAAAVLLTGCTNTIEDKGGEAETDIVESTKPIEEPQENDAYNIPELFEKLFAETTELSGALNTESDTYSKLLGCGDETLYQCFVYLYDHAKVSDLKQEDVLPQDVIMELVHDMLKSDNEECAEVIDVCMNDEAATGYKLFRLTKEVLRLQKAHGDEWLEENCSGFYQLTRAIMTNPEWRFLTDMLEGEVCYANIYVNANRAFMSVLSGKADESLISDGSDLELTRLVCNEDTKWTITQASDGTVTMLFEDITSGTKIGEMLYVPDESELNGRTEVCGQVTLTLTDGEFTELQLKLYPIELKNKYYGADNGILSVSEDERGESQSYYAVEDGVLYEVQSYETKAQFRHFDTNYYIDITWCLYDDDVSIQYTDWDKSEWSYNADVIAGRNDVISVQLIEPGTGDIYPVILNLETGEVYDILADCDVSGLSNIQAAAFTKNLKYALLYQYDREECIYIADTDSQSVTAVKELVNTDFDGCFILNDDTLCYWILDDNLNYSCWAYTLSTGSTRQVFAGEPCYVSRTKIGILYMPKFSNVISWGHCRAGGRYAVGFEDDGDVFYIDMLDGTKEYAEGFRWNRFWDSYGENPQFAVSNDGDEILLEDENYIGAVNFRDKTYSTISVEENIHSVWWFDRSRIIISSRWEDGYAYILSA